MYAGNMVEKAPVESIVHNSKHPYTSALMEATADPDANNALVYRELPAGEPPSLVSPPAGCRFHPRCPKMIDGECNVNKPPEFSADAAVVSCWLYK